jgi:hypothetical protein
VILGSVSVYYDKMTDKKNLKAGKCCVSDCEDHTSKRHLPSRMNFNIKYLLRKLTLFNIFDFSSKEANTTLSDSLFILLVTPVSKVTVTSGHIQKLLLQHPKMMQFQQFLIIYLHICLERNLQQEGLQIVDGNSNS